MESDISGTNKLHRSSSYMRRYNRCCDMGTANCFLYDSDNGKVSTVCTLDDLFLSKVEEKKKAFQMDKAQPKTSHTRAKVVYPKTCLNTEKRPTSGRNCTRTDLNTQLCHNHLHLASKRTVSSSSHKHANVARCVCVQVFE